MLSSFVHLEILVIGMNVDEIPLNAFLPINGMQSKFNSLNLYMKGNQLIIRKMTFFNLENLDNLYIASTNISKIEREAFMLDRKSNKG